jgi:hypothetical protein
MVRCFDFNSEVYAGFLVSVTQPGTYTVLVSGGSVAGHLEAEGKAKCEIANFTFVKEARFVNGDVVEQDEPIEVFVIVGAVVLDILVIVVSFVSYWFCWKWSHGVQDPWNIPEELDLKIG